MKVAVLGCGAIGGLFLGCLSKKEDVIGVVKDYQRDPLLKEGLVIEGARGNKVYKVKTATQLTEKVDIAILATKIDDLDSAIQKNLEYLKDANLLTTQNG
ncbi:MAG: hypothetical protein JSW17_00050, partial [Candidatus Omnitrophota bacterium]